MEYRLATLDDLNKIWDKNISSHPNDNRWVRWKKEYIDYNINKQALTYVVVDKGNPIGEVTLILSNECKAVQGKDCLIDSVTANMNAFRIEKKYEGQGHISKIVKMVEADAKAMGKKYLTIGVEAKETRNIAIYLHFGYTEFLTYEIDADDNELVLYYRKNIGG